jgi:hypothetical protein
MAKDRGFDGIIEEPSPYDTLATWERFLQRIEDTTFAPNAVPSKAAYLREARDNIARLKAAAEKKFGKSKLATA